MCGILLSMLIGILGFSMTKILTDHSLALPFYVSGRSCGPFTGGLTALDSIAINWNM